ncbi:MAG: trehalose-6-phosphate synthase [Candidatus Margulisiibacteriota bacterium]
MKKDLELFINSKLEQYKLVVVSNREPYEHKRVGNKVTCSAPKGGLVTALEPVLAHCRGTWIAWGSGNADREYVDKDSCLMVPPEKPAYKLHRIWLTEKEVDNYYFGLSNKVFWPLFHMMIGNVNYRERFWRDYQAVNSKFARAVLEECAGKEAQSIVWLHDFHLALAAGEIKKKAPSLVTTFFWHIPWPVWAIYSIFPKQKELIEGLLGNDILAFHTKECVKNFLDCVKYSLKVSVNYHDQTIIYNGHTTRARIFPISIDYEYVRGIALRTDEKAVIKKMKLDPVINDKVIGVGVDRLDYSKGIYEKFLAIDRFLDKYPQYKNRFVFIQKSSLSRTKLKAYRDYKHDLSNLICNINEKHRNNGWKPIIHITAPFNAEKIIALYKAADFCLVNSLMDGMNLVAKEFIAAQTNRKGALICSKYAGAVNELGSHLIRTDPRDIDDLADKIYQAVNMPQTQKQSKMKKMQDYVKKYDIFEWARTNLIEVLALKED